MRARPIVAIDGPSGAGKTTVSKAVAERLGFTYIDTGAMYRCVGLLADRQHLELTDDVELGILLDNLEIRFERAAEGQRVFANGEDVTGEIRRHDVSKLASDFSALPLVREKLVDIQRRLGAAGGIVMEGRDIGTNVFPDAEVKIYLTATDEVRARRRYDELVRRGQEVDFAKVLDDQRKRDANDSGRELNPLVPATDAIVLDSSLLPFDEVVKIVTGRVSNVATA
ncbi:(d)CMP kinase [bacterium]|nr:(d)CMP kinase [bacterium]